MSLSKSLYYTTVGPAAEVLKIDFIDIPEPEAHELQIEIYVSGINPSDVKTRLGQRGPLAFPKIIPHHDGAGVVKKVGTAVKEFKVGDRVWVYNAAWKRPYGTASELCTLPADQVVPLPKDYSFESGACLGIPAITAASCLLSLPFSKVQGKRVMITGGAGAVGLCAIQLAKFMQFEVLTTISSPQKAQLVRELGADFVINYRQENVLEKIKEFTQNELLDGLIDVDFGGNLEWSIDALKLNATLVSYASANPPAPILPFYPMMFKNITFKPTFLYTIEPELRKKAIQLIQQALNNKALQPLIHQVFNMDESIKAHEEVEASNKLGQVLLRIN